MLYSLATFAAVTLLARGQDEDDDYELGEMLDFVELNIATLLQHGEYPLVYNATTEHMLDCGCEHSLTKVMWGSEIGLQCLRKYTTEDDSPPEHDLELCGKLCNNHHNREAHIFCPSGWDMDCQDGCRPPAEFDTVEDRIDFWEFTLTSMLLYGIDYVNIDADYLEQCACESKPRPIRYGTKIGFDCVMQEDVEEFGEGCSAASMCKDDQGRRLVTFCPAGHESTCNGCTKRLEEDDLKGRLTWMVHVVEGIVQLSLPMLQWTPLQEQVLGCACAAPPKQIEYGSRLGYSCEIHDADLITSSCGANVICQDPQSEKDLVHICPRGFTPSCEHGCMNPVLRREGAKEEL